MGNWVLVETAVLSRAVKIVRPSWPSCGGWGVLRFDRSSPRWTLQRPCTFLTVWRSQSSAGGKPEDSSPGRPVKGLGGYGNARDPEGWVGVSASVNTNPVADIAFPKRGPGWSPWTMRMLTCRCPSLLGAGLRSTSSLPAARATDARASASASARLARCLRRQDEEPRLSRD